MAIPITQNLLMSLKRASIDSRFGPYYSAQEAYDALGSEGYGKIIVGMLFGLIEADGDVSICKWTKDGDNATADDYEVISTNKVVRFAGIVSDITITQTSVTTRGSFTNVYFYADGNKFVLHNANYYANWGNRYKWADDSLAPYNDCIYINNSDGSLYVTLDGTLSKISGDKSVTSINGKTGVVNLAKSDVGLGNVDNTADVNKSVASATKATQDAEGNVITTTYETKDDATAKQTAATNAILALQNSVVHADNEDVEKTSDGKLKFKNRGTTNGKGYIILRKDYDTDTYATDFAYLQAVMVQTNTIYEVRYDFDLNNDANGLMIPSNCILFFNGGKFSNGTIIGQNTNIKSDLVKIFSNITFDGTFTNAAFEIRWFVDKLSQSTNSNDLINCADQMQEAFDSGILSLHFTDGIYYIPTTVVVSDFVKITGSMQRSAKLSASVPNSCLYTDRGNTILKYDISNNTDSSIFIEGIVFSSNYYNLTPSIDYEFDYVPILDLSIKGCWGNRIDCDFYGITLSSGVSSTSHGVCGAAIKISPKEGGHFYFTEIRGTIRRLFVAIYGEGGNGSINDLFHYGNIINTCYGCVNNSSSQSWNFKGSYEPFAGFPSDNTEPYFYSNGSLYIQSYVYDIGYRAGNYRAATKIGGTSNDNLLLYDYYNYNKNLKRFMDIEETSIPTMGETDDAMACIFNSFYPNNWIARMVDNSLYIGYDKPTKADIKVIYKLRQGQSWGSPLYQATNLVKVCGSFWDMSQVITLSLCFSDSPALKEVYAHSWNLASCTDMGRIFQNCSALEVVDVADWKTPVANNMNNMFYYCTSLTSLNIASWNVSSVTNFSTFCAGCTSLPSLDISSWNLASCTKAGGFFFSCSSMTSIVMPSAPVCESLISLAENCYELQSITIGDYPMCTSIKKMCKYCRKLINLTMGDLSAVTDATEAFEQCYNIANVVCNGPLGKTNWDFSASYDLVESSLVSILNALVSLNEGENYTCSFRSSVYNLLSQEDIAIATNKGWTVVSV